MSSETTHPVIQIVDGDKQDIWRFVLGKNGTNQKQEAKICADSLHVISF